MQKKQGKINLQLPLLSEITPFWAYRWNLTEQISYPYTGKLCIATQKNITQHQKTALLCNNIRIQWFGDCGQHRSILAVVIAIKTITETAFPENFCYELTVTAEINLLSACVETENYVNKNYQQIIQEVLRKHKIHVCDFQSLQKNYPRLAYCVRYFENGLNFIHRLLATAGIHYTFKHTAQKSLMVLHDTEDSYKQLITPIPVYLAASKPKDLFGLGLWNWQSYINQRDDNAICPVFTNYILATDVQTVAQQAIKHPNFQQSNYYFETNALMIEPGVSLTIKQHPKSLIQSVYWVNKVTTHIIDYCAVPHFKQAQPAVFYLSVESVPEHDHSIPSPTYVQPKALGIDRATVVDFQQQTINVNALNQIKVQFEWDNTSKNNFDRSCWITVKQPWAGKNHGARFIPRIGQEVIVNYENGDPEKPIIFGTCFNSKNLPPFKPEDYPYRSGYQSRSQDEIDLKNGNCLLFDDDPTKPTLQLNAQKDLVIAIEGNKQTNITGMYEQKINNGDFIQVAGDSLELSSMQSIQLTNGASQIYIDKKNIVIESPSIIFKS